jgi:hypothetical protein
MVKGAALETVPLQRAADPLTMCYFGHEGIILVQLGYSALFADNFRALKLGT